MFLTKNQGFIEILHKAVRDLTLPGTIRGCDPGHSGCRLHRANLLSLNRGLSIAVRKRGTLMGMTRARALALLAIALLWAITPTMACVLPGATMTPAEHECCHRMAEQCGSSMMPASHSCCKAQAPTNTVLPQAQTAGPVRPLTVAVIPPAAFLAALPTLTLRSHLSFLHPPPPEPSPGCSSILRI